MHALHTSTFGNLHSTIGTFKYFCQNSFISSSLHLDASNNGDRLFTDLQKNSYCYIQILLIKKKKTNTKNKRNKLI